MKRRCRVRLQAVLVVVLVLLFGFIGKNSARAENDSKFVPGELLILVKKGVPKGEIDALFKIHGAATTISNNGIGIVGVSSSSQPEVEMKKYTAWLHFRL